MEGRDGGCLKTGPSIINVISIALSLHQQRVVIKLPRTGYLIHARELTTAPKLKLLLVLIDRTKTPTIQSVLANIMEKIIIK